MNETTAKLCNRVLDGLKKGITIPKYERTRTKPRILHIGVGGFHRAHMACYTNDLLAAGETDWSIHGVGLIPTDKKMAEILSSQDYLYTLITRGLEMETIQIIGSITNYFVAPDGAGKLCQRAAEEDYRIISLTVTENGYHYTGEKKELDRQHPDIIHDLEHFDDPRSPEGFIFRVAQLRIAAGRKLPTFLSCDNLPHNGSTLRKLILQYAQLVDKKTAAVLEKEGMFPNCMVDRITPATSGADKEYLKERWGISDAWPVLCEDFRQWYIEDTFSDGRPNWDRAGAAFVPDVTPFELMKIRLLNGSHSALAYISYLLGYRKVDAAMNDSDISQFVQSYMASIEPAVGTVPGVDLRVYREDLIRRFSNSAIGDQVLRLAEDGSRKIPNMMLEPVTLQIKGGHPTHFAAFALAAWIRFLQGTDEEGNPIPIKDPAENLLTETAKKCQDDTLPFINIASVFPKELQENRLFVQDINNWYTAIKKDGARDALRKIIMERGSYGER